MLDRSLVGFRSILVEWQLKTNFGCYSIWVGPLYISLLIRGQSAAIRGLDRGGAEGNPRGAAGAGGNPRNPPALQIRGARMKRLVSALSIGEILTVSMELRTQRIEQKHNRESISTLEQKQHLMTQATRRARIEHLLEI